MPPPPPFLIWTLRRTGGTTFTRLLHEASGRDEVWREPFGRHGALFGLRRRFVEDRDAARLAEGLEVALALRPNVKHCFEVCPARFNAVLLRTATRLGYRHLYLDRRDEAARIESLEFARITGAWGKGQAAPLQSALADGSVTLDPPDAALAERELRRSAVKRQQLFREMKARDTDPFVLFHEDLYRGDILARFRAAAAHCGIPGPLDEAAIAGQGQGRAARTPPRSLRRCRGWSRTGNGSPPTWRKTPGNWKTPSSRAARGADSGCSDPLGPCIPPRAL